MYDVKRDVAETIYISHPEASYGIFCFNSQGDLFINSDWGFYGYAWRSYGKDNPFKKFLSQCNAEYIVGKFSINHREVSGKKMPPHREKNLTLLVESFIAELKKELSEANVNAAKEIIDKDGGIVEFLEIESYPT